jgi:hypothetical protein
MLPSQHHASFSTTLKGFMVSLYARLKPFQHKINPHDYAMSLNLKAAKQISLTIPPNVLARADKVIR